MRVLLSLLFVVLTGCPLSPGDPCTTSGSGFTRTDRCSTQCIDWDITCPDGSRTTPGVCSGTDCTTNPNACTGGWSCVQVNATDSECLPPTVCGGLAAPDSADEQPPEELDAPEDGPQDGPDSSGPDEEPEPDLP